MRYFHKTNNQFWRPVINLDKLIVRAQLVPTPRLTLILTFAVGSDPQTLVPEEQRLKLEKDSTTVPVVDTLAAVSPRLAPRCIIIIPSLTIPCIVPQGYGKVLAKGRLQVPLIVKARFVSKSAENKIKEAGGVVKIVA